MYIAMVVLFRCLSQEGVEMHERQEEARRKARDEEFQRRRLAAAESSQQEQQPPAETETAEPALNQREGREHREGVENEHENEQQQSTPQQAAQEAAEDQQRQQQHQPEFSQQEADRSIAQQGGADTFEASTGVPPHGGLVPLGDQAAATVAAASGFGHAPDADVSGLETERHVLSRCTLEFSHTLTLGNRLDARARVCVCVFAFEFVFLPRGPRRGYNAATYFPGGV